MALQDKLRARAVPFLDPGEEIQHVVMAEAGSPPWLFFGALLGLGALFVWWLMRPLIIAVTDQRLVILRGSRFRPSFPKEVIARLPRQTRLGPTKGRLWARVDVAGQRVWIHRRFFAQVREADAPLLVPPSEPVVDFGMPLEPGPGLETPFPGPTVGTWPLAQSKGRTWQWVLAGVAGVLTLLFLIGVVAATSESNAQNRLKAYVAGTRTHSFVAADGRFKAEFPDPPRRTVQGETLSGANLQTIVYQRDVGLDTSFLISYVDVPQVPDDVTGALEAASKTIAAGLKGEILDSELTDFRGLPAIEYVIESRIKGGTKKVHYGKMLLVVDQLRLYTVGVLGPKNPPVGYDTFVASFTILP